MRKSPLRCTLDTGLLWLSLFCLWGCQSPPSERFPSIPLSPQLGGETTVSSWDHNAFSMPAANMPLMAKLDFSVGNSFFRNPWVTAPATTGARDGLGPLFNANACQACHIKDGRGHPPNEPGTLNNAAMLVRISLPAEDAASSLQLATLGAVPVANYGLQIQPFGVPQVPAEAQVKVAYEYFNVTLSGGEIAELRRPRLSLTAAAYGALPNRVLTSARIAPPMIGLGLLEAIPETALRQHEKDMHRRKENTAGKLNRVWDHTEQRFTVGRFGWKAGQPSLMQQNALAFHEDMGITSTLFAGPPCQTTQIACASAAHGGEPELSRYVQKQVNFYSANLAVPAMRDTASAEVRRGAHVFSTLGCSNCHRPHWKTGPSEMAWLANQDIYPYTDLMLHDMGEGLADHRPEFAASGREWRTPPLWGIGLTKTVVGQTFFLHDGRARNLNEAILWHGGQAKASREAYRLAPKEDRHALTLFLRNL